MGPELMLGMTAVSGIMGAVGKIQEGKSAAAAANYTAQVARNNAQIAAQNAEYSQQAGEIAAQGQDMKNRAALGAIEASQSASGLSIDSPSLVDIREGSAQVYRLDTANIMQNAALRARSYTTSAQNYEAEAGLQEAKAKDASSAGMLGAFGSLLTSGTSFAEKWNKYTLPAKV